FAPSVPSSPWCSSAVLPSGRTLVCFRETAVRSWLTCPPPAQPHRTGGLRRSGKSRARCTSSIASVGEARRDTKVVSKVLSKVLSRVLSKVLFRVVLGRTGGGELRRSSRLHGHKHAIGFRPALN